MIPLVILSLASLIGGAVLYKSTIKATEAVDWTKVIIVGIAFMTLTIIAYIILKGRFKK